MAVDRYVYVSTLNFRVRINSDDNMELYMRDDHLGSVDINKLRNYANELLDLADGVLAETMPL